MPPSRRNGKIRIHAKPYGELLLTPSEAIQLDAVAAQIGCPGRGGRTRVIAAILGPPTPRSERDQSYTAQVRAGLADLNTLGRYNTAIAERLPRGERLIIEDRVDMALIALDQALLALLRGAGVPVTKALCETLTAEWDAGQADSLLGLLPPSQHEAVRALVQTRGILREIEPYLTDRSDHPI